MQPVSILLNILWIVLGGGLFGLVKLLVYG